MYAVYTYAAGSTAANILADVVKILTGETLLSNLSANCVQASSSILTTATPAGWSVWDAAAGTNLQVIRSPWDVSNGSGYNYVGVDTNTAGYISLNTYETWNNSTHIGTNGYVPTPSASGQRLNLASGGTLYIGAQNGHSIYVMSYQSGVWGSTNITPLIFAERTRRSAWDTNSLAYPVGSLIVYGSYGSFGQSSTYANRIVNYVGTDSTIIAGHLVTPFGGLTGNTNATQTWPTTTVPMANKVLQHMLVPMWHVLPVHGFLGGDCSIFSDIWFTTTTGASLDEVIVNGNSYVVFGPLAGGAAYVPNRIAVRKG